MISSPGRGAAVTVARMGNLDQRAVHVFGIPVAALMENAGRAVAEEVLALGRGPVVLFCGTGHNGGDGLVAARWLLKGGRRVRVLLAKPPARLAPLPRTLWRGISRMGIPWTVFEEGKKLVEFCRGVRVGVDALLGTGLRAPVEPPYDAIIEGMNRACPRLLSVDVPSGLSADTGRPLGPAVRAKVTVTMGRAKRGLVQPAAKSYVGRLVVADIGFPPAFGRG